MFVTIARLGRRARHRVSGQRGFTIIEVLIAMALMMVVMIAVYAIWFGLQRTYSFTNEDMTAQDQARSALSELVQSIRTARQPTDPSIPESLDLVIVSADANTLVCWTDTNRDPQHQLELVRYRVDSATRSLYRERESSPPYDLSFATTDSEKLVANWVSNSSTLPLFSYSDANGTPLPTPVADPTQIRDVTIDLRIDVRTNSSPIAHELRSVVQPRNLRQY